MKTYIKGNVQLAREYLQDIYYNDQNNTILDVYGHYRCDQISIAQKLKEGLAVGMVYVFNNDDCFVLETKDDLFCFAQTDDSWLEYVSNNFTKEIANWLTQNGIDYAMEEEDL